MNGSNSSDNHPLVDPSGDDGPDITQPTGNDNATSLSNFPTGVAQDGSRGVVVVDADPSGQVHPAVQDVAHNTGRGPTPGPPDRPPTPRSTISTRPPSQKEGLPARAPSRNVITGSFEQRFKANQDQRRHEFLQQEEERSRRFEEAESAKSKAELARTLTFTEQEDDKDQVFRVMMALHKERFTSKEDARSWGEEWRAQQSLANEEYRSLVFRHMLQGARKQYNAVAQLETAAMHSSIDRIMKLDSEQKKALEEARQQRVAAFAQAEARREKELQVPTSEKPASPALSIHESMHLPSPDYQFNIVPLEPATVPIIAMPPIIPEPIHVPLVIPPTRTPPTGFVRGSAIYHNWMITNYSRRTRRL